MSEPIYIFTPQDTPYGPLSVMASTRIYHHHMYWRTAEHCYQAMKFITTDPAHVQRIRNAPTAQHARQLGHNSRAHIRHDWAMVKTGIMYEVQTLKFEQHVHLADLLIATHPAPIVEHSTSSLYWGAHVDSTSGENRLGHMLMTIRETLRHKTDTSTHK